MSKPVEYKERFEPYQKQPFGPPLGRPRKEDAPGDLEQAF